MSTEQDLREHQNKEAEYQKAYEYLFHQNLEDETILEAMMMDNYPELYAFVEDLNQYHKGMLSLYSEGYRDEVMDKWLEYVHDETIRRLEG